MARKAKENIHLANLEEVITIHNTSFQEFEPPAGPGVIIMNPPYGERMHLDEDILGLYQSIGDTFKNKYKGYSGWIISSNMEALKKVGLRPSKKTVIFNGPLECRFVGFDMYEGTKRVFKPKENNAD